MSQENVEVVLEAYAAISRGDFDAALDAFDDEAEHDWSRSVGPYVGVYKGRVAARAFWTSVSEVFDQVAFEVEETLDAEPHVIAFVRVFVRGLSSGAEPVARGAHVWTFRNGKAIRFQLLQGRHEALEVVGLSE